MRLLSISALIFVSTMSVSLPVTAQNTANNEQICTETDCTKELRKLMRLARAGSGDAAAIVAMSYATGDGLEKNTSQALRYLRQGVRQRNPMSVYLMSDWLRNGFVIEQDLVEADRLLEQAISLNYAPAQYAKAVTLLQTEDPTQIEQAAALLEQASEQKLATAMLLLGQLKQHGIGTDKDLIAAAELFKRLVLIGQTQAKPYLAEVSTELAASNEHAELVKDLQQVENIEVIRVTGQQIQMNNMLAGLVKRLNSSGLYDSRSVGSRIRGVSCEQSGSNCASIKPDSSSSSINQVLSGGQ